MINSRKVALTIDDLPFTSPHTPVNREEGIVATRLLLQQLKQSRVKAVGFVIGGFVDKNNWYDLLKSWHAEGHILANHTYSHLPLKQLLLADFMNDVVMNEAILKPFWEEDSMSQHYFRFPYLDYGISLEQRKEAIAYLNKHSYTITPVTVDAKDYIYDTLYTYACMNDDNKMIENIVDSYLEHTRIVIEYRDRQALHFVGRPLGQVMLIHANRINANCLSKVIEIIRQEKYEFVSLQEVLKEPIYQQGIAIPNMERFLTWESQTDDGVSIQNTYPKVDSAILEAYNKRLI